MGLLSALSLPLPRARAATGAAIAPKAPATLSSTSDASDSGELKTPPQAPKPISQPQIGATPFKGGNQQREPFDMKDLDEFFPVTLNGKTKEMIAKELENARMDFGMAAAQEQAMREQYSAAEKTLAPLAKRLEEMMKTPVATLTAEIQQNTTGPMINIGRRAQAALNQRNTAATLLKTVKDLAERSKSEVEEVAKRMKAAAETEKAAGLREEAAKITEVFEFFEKILDVGIDLASGEEFAVAKSIGKITLWAGKAASGADALIAQAAALEREAKELQDDALRQQSESVAKLFRSLGDDAHRAQKDLAASDRALAQNAGDAQHAYDRNKNRKNKSSFKFSDFEEGVKLGEASLELLAQSAQQLRDDMAQISRYGNELGDLLRASGKCLTHHDHVTKYPDFQPDPRVVQQKTAEMKAQVKAALVEIVEMKKRIDDEFSDISEGTAFLRLRQQEWTAYYAAAQDALYSTPEPD
jgi:hypothetical protein